jgi:hypothetical protein
MASEVRALMASRSHSATAIRTCATSRPVMVEVSMPMSSATTDHLWMRAVASIPEKSCMDRDSRSSLATMTACAWRVRSISSATRRPGRSAVLPDSPSSATHSTSWPPAVA